MLGGGLLAINVGAIWDLSFPINKSLWTSTFVLVTSGIGSLFVGGFHWTVERLGWARAMMPMVVIGRNLLVAYLMVSIIPFTDLSLRLTGGDVSILLGGLAPYVSAAVEFALVWGALYFLYHHDMTVRV